jgi:AI-2 transport protein TqsA
VLGLIPPALVAWLVIDWQTAVIIAIGYSVLNVVVQTLIQPKVVGDRVQLNTTLTFLALVVWTFLLGGLGAILAIPMTLLIRALFIDSRPQHRWVRTLFSSGPPAGTARKKKKAAPAIADESPAPDEAPSSVAP